jgi:5-methylcytosine-specific restriction endonuclease McrA
MYCGVVLDAKFHVDHMKPIYRHWPNAWKYVNDLGKDEVENLGPACPPCNLWKSTHSIEQFRHEIMEQPDRVKDKSGGFRLAQRFGLIMIERHSVIFWFEKFASKETP